MPELDDAALERRLRGVLKEHLETLPLDLTVETLDRRREAMGAARRSSRGRGITLLAAAALLIVGGALAAGSGLLRLPTIVPPVPEPSVIAVATGSPDSTSPSPSESAAPSASPIPVAGPGGVWIPTGTMNTPRYEHSAVRLLDGRVLVVGGVDGPGPGDDLTSAELYDPESGTWSAAGQMVAGGGAPILLNDGKVLIGEQLYDPQDGTWSATGKMVAGGWNGAATLLRDGRVLVAGLDGAQVYDPDNGTWSATANMTTPRYYATATLLDDGRVLVAGGYVMPDVKTDVAELYDPNTGAWTAAASMNVTHGHHKATLLRDGKVLVTGQSDTAAFHGFDAEVFDAATGTWTTLPVNPNLGYHPTSLSDGTVLMTGGWSQQGPQPPCTATELYDPRTGSWTTASSMLRCGHTSYTLLLDGTVLAAGGVVCNGDGSCVYTGSAELYVPQGVSLPPLPAFPSPPPPVFPSPTPRPTPLPPAAGPVPPNARSWKVTVDNKSPAPATLFVAEEDEDGMSQLVGSATPNVVPAGATVKVTFRFPAKGDPDDGWIFVNPRPGEGGSLVNADQIGIPGKIVITAEGQVVWASP